MGLVSPVPGTVSGTVLLQAEASDDRGVAGVDFYLDGGLLGSDVSAPYSFSWNATTATPGVHVLSARAYDLAGNVGTSGDVLVSVPDQTPPSVQATQPTGGSTVSGTVAVAVTVSDNVGVALVELYVDSLLLATDDTAPYEFAWNTTGVANGSHSLFARAADPSGNVGLSGSVTVVVSNQTPGNAAYDPVLRAPRCTTVASRCDSGTLLVGRGPVGPEPGQPNTIASSCSDGTAGGFHSDESNDRIEVSTLDGSPLATGKAVRVRTTVWAWAGYTSDKLDLYTAADATSPVWTFRGTFTPAGPGSQVLTTTFVLPTGGLQAVRARFRYGGSSSPCGAGPYNDHDDLVFAVEGGVDAPPSVQITASPDGATVMGAVGVLASATDNSGVVKVEFLVDGQVQFTDTAPPDWFFPWWDTTLVANGTHTLLARAYDTVGNVGQSPPVTVTVQNPQGTGRHLSLQYGSGLEPRQPRPLVGLHPSVSHDPRLRSSLPQWGIVRG